MLNEELRQRLANKIRGGEFTASDLLDFLTAFCEMCNESEDIQSEVKAWNAKLLQGVPRTLQGQREALSATQPISLKRRTDRD